MINGYWNDSGDLFLIKKPLVVFGDHTKTIKFIDFDFVKGADGVKILQPIDSLNPKFFYYALNNIGLRDLGYARHFKLLKEKFIPIPSIEEQKQIVKILDRTFNSLKETKEAAEKNDFSEKFLKNYSDRLWDDIGNELSVSHKLQKIGRYRFLLNFVIRKAATNKNVSEIIAGMIANEEKPGSGLYRVLGAL